MTADDGGGPADGPGFATLLDWVEGRLDAEADARVAAAVAAGDARVRRTVEWLRGFLGTAQALPLHPPPPIVGQHLRQYFARWSSARAALHQPPAEHTASLLFDSRRDLALVGLRAADDSDDTVHLAFSTPVADLVLDVRRLDAATVSVDGQVLLAEPGAAPIFEASARGAGGTVRAVDGDELGRFRLPRVPDRVTELRVGNGEIVIVATVDLAGEQR